jgi:hypothetical protein
MAKTQEDYDEEKRIQIYKWLDSLIESNEVGSSFYKDDDGVYYYDGQQVVIYLSMPLQMSSFISMIFQTGELSGRSKLSEQISNKLGLML